MKFSTREDIEAPMAVVFAKVSDFASFERQALRRGADVRQLDGPQPPAVGARWAIAFKFGGKDRALEARLADVQPPQSIRVETTSPGIDSVARIDLMALTPQRTRISVSIDVSARTLSARLMLQSLKLAKTNLNGRLQQRVAEFAQTLEDGHRRKG